MPLHIASDLGQAETVLVLVKAAADSNAKNSYNETPLYMATYRGHIDITQTLLTNGTNVDARTDTGKALLHFAAGNGHTGIVRMLLEKDADLALVDKDSNNPFQLALVSRNIGMAKALNTL
jgi:ankyrin repeat protein